MTIRLLLLAAAAAAVTAAVPARAADGTTSSTTSTSVEDRDGHVERVIVLTDRHRDGRPEDARHDGERDRVHVFSMNGADVAHCERDRPLVDRSSPDGHDRARVIICRRGEGPHPDGERQRVRVFGMNGPDGVDCNPDHPLVDRSSPDGHDRTKVIICGHGEATIADRTARLEHVIERIQHMDGLPDSSKDRVTAALREAIEQLHNAQH